MPAHARENPHPTSKILYLEIAVLVLSLYSLTALAAELLLPLDPALRALLRWLDNFVCGVFLAEFIVHLILAPSKRDFWKLGWIDLLSSIPEITWLRWGRVFRVIRIVRTLRSFSVVSERIAADRARGTFAMVGLMSVIAVLIATIAVLEFERGAPDANIHTGSDALWWAFATITTIGYGDHFPVTPEGRTVAVVLVVLGLSFFGTFTAYVASFFLEKTQLREESEIHRLTQEIRHLRETVERLVGPRSSGAAAPSTADHKRV